MHAAIFLVAPQAHKYRAEKNNTASPTALAHFAFVLKWKSSSDSFDDDSLIVGGVSA